MTIEERAKLYAEKRFAETITTPEETLSERQKARIMHGHEMIYVKIATEQKEIDDAILKETQRQRDEYYDDLLKLRSEKIAVINKVREFLEKALPSYIDIIDDIIDRDAIIEQLCKAMEE